MKKNTVKRLRRILLVVEIVFAVIVLSGIIIWAVPSFKQGFIRGLMCTSWGRSMLGWFGKDTYNEKVVDTDFNAVQEVVTNPGIDKDRLEQYTQILIVGIDTRNEDFDKNVNSDVMMILTINKDTNDVSLVSVYRDTVMQMVNDQGEVLDYYAKANAAYCNWGIKGTINTLNTNLDMHISDYAILNFQGVATIVDAMGGIDVNLTQGEVYQLNLHLSSTKKSTGMYSPNVKKAGKNHLNGLQATTYCRIRKTTYIDEETGEEINDDMGRAARQQATIRKLVARAKKIGLLQTLDVMKTVFEQNTEDNQIFKTSMTWDELLLVASAAFDFDVKQNQGYPFHYSYANLLLPGNYSEASYVVGQGTAYNVKKLHEYIYGDKDYQVSDRISTIDQNITYYTGVYPYTGPEEESTLPEESGTARSS